MLNKITKPIKTNAAIAAVLSLLSIPVLSAIVPDAPTINAKSYLLIDIASGQVLAENAADEPLPPASLTKMMTDYVLSHELDEGNVKETDLADISENAWAKKFPGSSLMWIEVGTKVALSDLHRGIIISSGNDASVAVAEHLAGSESAFADVMNEHADSLDMVGSHFVNSHGLPHPEHYTTARDLAILAKAIITKHPEHYKIYSEREYTYNNITQPNRNKLLWRDNTVDGLKTGHTREAGYCLVSSAKRNDMRLVSVVLGADSVEARLRESQKLLAYGFRYFETRKVLSANEPVADVKVWEGEKESLSLGVGEEIHLTIPKRRHDDLQIITDVEPELLAPIEAGKRYGTLRVTLDGETLVSTPLLAMHEIQQSGFVSRLWDTLKRRLQGMIGGDE